jgi:hypothetical protein
MTSNRQPLHHIVRVRRTEDLTFLRDGIMDEVLVNANQLENNPDSTATALRSTTLPFSIDPMLTRFQMPAWWRNSNGENKRNYTRLGRAYVKDTSIQLPAGPLAQTVADQREWETLARNTISYQGARLEEMVPAQLELLSGEPPRLLRPARLTAPALVAFSTAEDHINRLLAEASVETATLPLAVQVIVPLERLTNPSAITEILESTPRRGVDSYLVWTPGVSEERLLADHRVFATVLRLIGALAERGIPVGHLHATYPILALHDAGVAAATHHLGWTDKGEPAGETRGGVRSCQTYLPGLRHCVRFGEGHRLGDELDAATYSERYCRCAFCTGAFKAGAHPLRLLLEDHVITFKNGAQRRTPTGRAVELNTWHYLLSRRQEIEAFSTYEGAEVIAADIQRAATLAEPGGAEPLRRLAQELRSA